MVDFSKDIAQCIQVLSAGGVIVYPTDTVWGIGCDATNPEAIEKVFALKNRPAHKSMIVLLADVADLAHYTTPIAPGLLQTIGHFDRPTTVIYPDAQGLAPNALAEDGSIGIRIVQEAFCRQLIRASGKPLISTSANLSGMPTASFYQEIHPDIITGADYVVQYRQDDETAHLPSRIVRINIDGSLEVIRP